MLRAVLHRVTRSVRAPVKRLPVLVDAPADRQFSVSGGPLLKNVKELHDALKRMSDGQYHYHTVPRGNDFSRWVKEVLGQATIAKKLEKAKSRFEAVKALE
jgi:hypothetical protein